MAGVEGCPGGYKSLTDLKSEATALHLELVLESGERGQVC